MELGNNPTLLSELGNESSAVHLLLSALHAGRGVLTTTGRHVADTLQRCAACLPVHLTVIECTAQCSASAWTEQHDRIVTQVQRLLRLGGGGGC